MKQLFERQSIKIIAPPLLALVLFTLSLFVIILPSFENSLLERKKEMLRELTGTALDILSLYEKKIAQGEMGRDKAQEAAREELRQMRYGKEGRDYFWINDLRPVMIMHPYRTDLEGKDVADFKAPNGNYLFRDFVARVQAEGDSYVQYMWQWHDDPARIVPKVSYVKLFQPWGWVVGTGVYIDDVKNEIGQLIKRTAYLAAGVLFLVSLLSVYIIRQGMIAAKRRKAAEDALRQHLESLEGVVAGRTADLIAANDQLQKEIQERKGIEADLRESKDQYLDLVDHANDLVQSVGPDGTFLYVNRAWKETLGYTDAEIPHLTMRDIIHPDGLGHCLSIFQQVLAGEKVDSIEATFIKKNGEKVVVEGNVNCKFVDGLPQFTRSIFRDITIRKKAEERIRQQNVFLNEVIESIPYPFYVVDASDYSIVLANSLTAKDKSWYGAKCYKLTHARDTPCLGDADHICPLEIVKKTGKPVHVEHIHFDEHGKRRIVEVHGYPIFDDQGNVAQMIEASLDITERKMLETQLKEISITDDLTGLFNRRGFMTMAGKQLDIASRQAREMFLLYADLDNLKWINDKLGHESGDQALLDTAEVLKTTFRQSDIIARIGGDEFTVMLTGVTDAESEQSISQRFSRHIVEFNARKLRKYELSLSYGVVRYDPANPVTVDELLARADGLMYEEKRQKKADLAFQMGDSNC